MKKRVFDVIDIADSDDTVSKAFDGVILSLITLNVIAIILETVPGFQSRYQGFFYWIEIISVSIFTAEYLLRVWTCTEYESYSSGVRGRLKFMLTPLLLIDLLAILPFYFSFLLFDLRVLRAFRLLRIFRVAKLGRYSQAMKKLLEVITDKKEELVAVLFVQFILFVISSCLIFYAEKHVGPDTFSSIPEAMWWSVSSLTPMTPGEIVPQTFIGRLLGSFSAVLGVGVFALPSGIIAASFIDKVRHPYE